MSALSFTVAHLPGEALPSFLGRTAARNGVDVASFCREMGLSLVDVANGVTGAVDRLAALTGADRAALRRHALVRKGDRTWTLNGEVVDWHMLRRLNARVCPVCLIADAAAGRSAHCRTSWLIEQIRTCPVHAVGLVALRALGGQGVARWQLHDFVGRLSSSLGEDGVAGLPIRRTYVSGLDYYLHRRLSGGKTEPWIDALPFNVVATFTERLGVAALHGPGVRFNDLGPDDWKAAGDAGWEVMRLGERGLGLFASALDHEPGSGLKGALGEFWSFLLRASRKDGYQPLCRMFLSGVDVLPPSLPPRLTGGEGGRRIRLSAASAECRRNPSTVRRVLSRHGLLGTGHEEVAARRIVLDREAVTAAMAEHADRLSLAEAGRHANAPNRQIGLLHAAGLFGEPASERRRGVNVTVSRRAIDAFLRDLTKDAVERPRALAGEGTLLQAARSARRPLADVTRLVVGGRLGWVGLQVGVSGFSAVLVRLEEVRAILNGGDRPGHTSVEVSRILRIPYAGVNALIDDGHLTGVMVRQRRTGQPYRVVDPVSLRAFERVYASISAVARRWGIHPHAARTHITASGVEVALSPERYGTPIYAMHDVRDR